jgi:hypothetical protein
MDDNLAGTAAPIGDPTNSAAEWNIKFDTLSFDKYLFAYGNFKYWGIINKTTVETCDGSPATLELQKSSLSET